MMLRRPILIVAENPIFLTTLTSWIEPAGYHVTTQTSYKAARAALASKPALLIADLKLGEYNGLHLSMHSRLADIPSIVIGPPDAVLIRDAGELGSLYVPSPVRQQQILALIAEHAATPAAFVQHDTPEPRNQPGSWVFGPAGWEFALH